MSEQDTTNTTEAQKTVIAFIAGLLIGGLLVWIFGGTPEDTADRDTANDDEASEVEDVENDTDEADEDADDDTVDTVNENAEMQTGDGSIEVNDQPASSRVQIEGAVFPTDEGWIAVRDYNNGQLGSILGATRYSRSEGRIPESVGLLRATSAGNEYAVVFYTESGDRKFSVANDVMISGVLETFRAR